MKKILEKHKTLIVHISFSILFIFIVMFFLYSRGVFDYYHKVVITPTGFNPTELSIKKGDTVVFSTELDKPFWPASDLHPTHGIYPEFDPKKPITPGESWSFQFNEIGNWRYHDHLNPNFTGLIRLSQNRLDSPELSYTACLEVLDIYKKEKCWNDQLAVVLNTEGLDKAFDLFVKLYNSEPAIPKSCHGWTHTLGKSAFDLFNQSQNVVLRKEVSFCGYGFFHGFIEKLIQTTGDVKKAIDFCDYASKQLGQNARGTYQNCVHGIGHGSVDVDNTALWGNFQDMTDSGIKRCEFLFVDKEELDLCFDGVFNAMGQISYLKEYGFDLVPDDLYSNCRTQKERYKTPCFTQFTGLIGLDTVDFKTAVGIIEKNILSDETAVSVYKKLGAGIIQYDIVKESQLDNVKNCRSLPTLRYEACFHGLTTGFISHGEPEKEYIKALEFCNADYLTSREKDICFQPILQQLISRNSPVCAQVDVKYQKYCY